MGRPSIGPLLIGKNPGTLDGQSTPAIADLCGCACVQACVLGCSAQERALVFRAGVGGTKEMFAPGPITMMLRYCFSLSIFVGLEHRVIHNITATLQPD